MSNPPPPDESKDETLAALHGLESADEAAEREEAGEHDDAEPSPEADPEAHNEGTPSSAASGFVGMLAKEGAEGQASGAPIRSKRYEIQMAREVSPAERPPIAAADTPRAPVKKPIKQVPGWYHPAVPIMYTLGSLLILIGLWAIGALIYMAVTTPGEADVGYWWIAKHMDEESGAWSYSSGSKFMAFAMLLCLPVAFAMGLMGAMMRKQIRAADRAAGK